MPEEFEIHNEINAKEVWAGIGGHFDNICQILCEFIDNSISNFIKHNIDIRDIKIQITEIETNGPVIINIQDTGTGILDINSAFCLGSKKAQETPLNEHGFGLKHALASANPENDHWSIKTCTEKDIKENKYRVIKSPFRIGAGFKGEIDIGWNKEDTGTIIEFKCSRELFKIAGKGIPGGAKSISTLAKYIAEDLGFIYSKILSEERLTITIDTKDLDGKRTRDPVHAVEPEWLDFLEPDGNGETNFDLGGGIVKLKYKFGSIKESHYYKYYKKSMSTSGIEIRINGRVMTYNRFKEIWDLEKHNSYNYFLGIVDIISPNREALPTTRTSKNGIREGDPKLDALYE